MLFNSYAFLFLFLPVVLLVVFGLRRIRAFVAAEIMVILASLFFYAWWDWRFVFPFLLSVALNWRVGSYIANLGHTQLSKRVLGTVIAVNLAVLVYFKYWLLLVDLVALKLNSSSAAYVWILPLGISFWTFEQIIYVVDCYRYPERYRDLGFRRYLFFVSFFPRLIAGPIVKPGDFFGSADRWRNSIPESFVAAGLTLVAVGMAKKVCISDSLSTLAAPAFRAADAGAALSLVESWIGVLGFTFQIYYDFSGYSDIAIGLALILGIRLPANFDSPYKSRSIIEFWKRWHISLSTFLRDYLYFPLGGNRLGVRRQLASLLITMVLGGLWHGAGFNFFIWGLLHGIYLVVAHGYRRLTASGRAIRLPRIVSLTLTLLAVVVGWVFFRADTPAGAVRLLGSMLHLDGSSVGIHSLTLPTAGLFVMTFVHCLVFPSSSHIFGNFILNERPLPTHGLTVTWIPTVRWAAVTALFLGAAIWMMLDSRQQFIYFQF